MVQLVACTVFSFVDDLLLRLFTGHGDVHFPGPTSRPIAHKALRDPTQSYVRVIESVARNSHELPF
jgi:hypothetical protein